MASYDGPEESPGDDVGTIPARASDADKLRIIRDIVEGQSPFGSELANFQRRLRIILDIQ
jgi:hypothetical protein